MLAVPPIPAQLAVPPVRQGRSVLTLTTAPSSAAGAFAATVTAMTLGVDASCMSLLLHDRGIHALWPGTDGASDESTLMRPVSRRA